MGHEKEHKNFLMKAAAVASVTVAGLGIIIKFVVFLLTGSIAVLSTLFDSLQDLLTSGINFFAIHHALQPADKHHRFGHGKAQAIGAMVQGFIIALSCVFLLKEAWMRLFHTQDVAHLDYGMIGLVIVILITWGLIAFQGYVVRQTDSLSIKADKAHYDGDILMNIGVLLSMAVTHYFKWYWVDAVFGIAVSAYLAWVVYGILKEAIAMLMDTEMPPEFRRKLERLVLSHPDIKAIYALKTRTSGEKVFVQFVVAMDGNLTLKHAHDKINQLERKIKENYPNVQVLIHPEPAKERKAHG